MPSTACPRMHRLRARAMRALPAAGAATCVVTAAARATSSEEAPERAACSMDANTRIGARDPGDLGELTVRALTQDDHFERPAVLGPERSEATSQACAVALGRFKRHLVGRHLALIERGGGSCSA